MVSPFVREDVAAAKLSVSAERRFAASSKLLRVRVEDSKIDWLPPDLVTLALSSCVATVPLETGGSLQHSIVFNWGEIR
jgi:hypothetical protein